MHDDAIIQWLRAFRDGKASAARRAEAAARNVSPSEGWARCSFIMAIMSDVLRCASWMSCFRRVTRPNQTDPRPCSTTAGMKDIVFLIHWTNKSLNQQTHQSINQSINQRCNESRRSTQWRCTWTAAASGASRGGRRAGSPPTTAREALGCSFGHRSRTPTNHPSTSCSAPSPESCDRQMGQIAMSC